MSAVDEEFEFERRMDMMQDAIDEKIAAREEAIRDAISGCDSFYWAENRDHCGWCKEYNLVIDLDDDEDRQQCMECFEEDKDEWH